MLTCSLNLFNGLGRTRCLVCTEDNAVDARSVAALKSVSTGEYAVNARIVEAQASVSTGDDADNARSVKVGQNQSWFRRSESEMLTSWVCAMMLRTPTSALSAWTPLVIATPLYWPSAGIVTTPAAGSSWKMQAFKGAATDVRGRRWPLGFRTFGNAWGRAQSCRHHGCPLMLHPVLAVAAVDSLV